MSEHQKVFLFSNRMRTATRRLGVKAYGFAKKRADSSWTTSRSLRLRRRSTTSSKSRASTGNCAIKATVHRSRNSLIRVALPGTADPSGVRKPLEDMGCSAEWLPEYSLLAVSVPEEVRLADVQSYLSEGASDGRWEYEEPILRQ